MNKHLVLYNMQDNNRPEGLWGDVYDRITSAKSKKATQPYYIFPQWESDAVEIILDELNKKLNLK